MVSYALKILSEILTVRLQFKVLSNFLWPFKLKAPLGGLKKKRRNHDVEGDDTVNRKSYITV